jgi:hypothetical protein
MHYKDPAASVYKYVLQPLTVNSKSEQKDDSLPPLRFESATFGKLAHLLDHSTKVTPFTLRSAATL